MKEIIKKFEADKLLLEVNKYIYEIKAIIQTSYKFTDKCYVHIDPISEQIIGVYFKNKPENNIPLEDIANQFCNELIDQQARLNTEKSYSNIRDAIVKKAFSPIDKII